MRHRTLVRWVLTAAAVVVCPMVAEGALSLGGPATAPGAAVAPDSGSHGVWAAVAAFAALAASRPGSRPRR